MVRINHARGEFLGAFKDVLSVEYGEPDKDFTLEIDPEIWALGKTEVNRLGEALAAFILEELSMEHFLLSSKDNSITASVSYPKESPQRPHIKLKHNYHGQGKNWPKLPTRRD